MQILVTGGTGFIGSRLCRRLLAAGHGLTVLSRQPEPQVRALLGQAVRVIADVDGLGPGARFDGIVNLAGAPIIGPHWTRRRKQVLWDSRIGITEKILRHIRSAEQKPAVFISGSAVGYYGDRGDELLDENASVGAGFGADLCSAWEQAAMAAAAEGVRVCLLRTGLVVGKGGGFVQRMLWPFRLGLGGRIGDGRQWMSWIHLADHVAITEMLLGTDTLAGIFNAVAPNPVSNREFTESLARVLGRPALLPVPAGLLRLLMGEMAGLLLGGQKVEPRRLREAGFRFSFPGLDDALREVLA